MNTSKRILIFPIAILLILFFQNCSNNLGVIELTGGTSSKSSSDDPAPDSGNGTGYGGKIDGGIFYHYVPGYQCEGHQSAFAKLDYKPKEATSDFYQSRESACLSNPMKIDNTLIDPGHIQDRVIGFEEKILETKVPGSTAIPQSVVEIWCVDQWNNPNIEIISSYNSLSHQAQTDFYYPLQSKRSEANPARTTGIQTVHLTSSYFDIVVDKTKLGLKPGTYQGELQIFEGQSSKQTLQCRLGGVLDARLWPAKAVNLDNAVKTLWNPLEKIFYLASGYADTAVPENHLYSYDPISQLRIDLISNVGTTNGVQDFYLSPDRSSLIAAAQLEGDKATQLYVKTLQDQTPPKLLNARLVDKAQGVIDYVSISPDGRYVFYKDGAQETGGDIERWLRVVDTKSGSIYQVNQDLNGADLEVRVYDVSFSLGKVIYGAGGIYLDLWVAGLTGANPHKLNVSSVVGSNYNIAWYIQRGSQWLFVEDRYLVLNIPDSSNLMASSLVYVVDLQSETVVFSKLVSNATSVKVLKDVPGFISLASSGTTGMLLNLKTMALLSESDTIKNLKLSVDAQDQELAWRLEIMTSTNLCPNMNESQIQRAQLDPKTWLVVNQSSTSTKLAGLYMKTAGQDSCALVNTMAVPSNGMSLSSLSAVMSANQKNILVALNGRIYLVPTDRRPIIEVFTASNATPKVTEIGFVNDSKAFYKGELIHNQTVQLFIWDLPAGF